MTSPSEQAPRKRPAWVLPVVIVGAVLMGILVAGGIWLNAPAKPALSGPDCTATLRSGSEFTTQTETTQLQQGTQLIVGASGVGLMAVGYLEGHAGATVMADGVRCTMIVGATYDMPGGQVRLDKIYVPSPASARLGAQSTATFTYAKR